MKTLWPVIRLALITVSILIVVGMGAFLLRQMALQTAPFLAPLPMRGATPAVFAWGDQSDQAIPAIEVRASSAQEWIVQGMEPLELKDSSPRLADFLKSVQPRQLMIIVHSREVAAAGSLLKVLGERDEPQITFIFSPNHRLNRELRKLRPRWLFGADASQWTQWHVFAALGLEPLVSSDFDWYFHGAPWGRAKPATRRIRQELARRGIGQILIGEKIAPELKPDLYGVLTKRPTEVLRDLNAASPSNR
jgi:hypothetical protein